MSLKTVKSEKLQCLNCVVETAFTSRNMILGYSLYFLDILGLTKHKSFDFKVTFVLSGFLKKNFSETFSDKNLESEVDIENKLVDEKIALCGNTRS